jgi:hypothetical protein
MRCVSWHSAEEEWRERGREMTKTFATESSVPSFTTMGVICPTGAKRKFVSRRRDKNNSVLQKLDWCYGLVIPPRLKRGDRERHERGVRDAVDANALTDERR